MPIHTITIIIVVQMKKVLTLIFLHLMLGKAYARIDTLYYDSHKLKIKATGNFSDTLKIGFWTYWHENGVKSSEGNYKQNMADGYWQNWDSLGRVTGLINWKEGKKEGLVKGWNYETSEYAEANYKDDALHGPFMLYTVDKRQVVMKGVYDNGVTQGE